MHGYFAAHGVTHDGDVANAVLFVNEFNHIASHFFVRHAVSML
jgi:hypothetical protein